MILQNIPIALIDDAPINPNVMPEYKYRALVAAIGRFGFRQNVIVEAREDGRYTMRDGHHRKKAALELSMTDLPAFVLEEGDDAAALMLAMNNIRGDIDLALAAGVVSDLSTDGWTMAELEVTGFSAVELRDLLGAAGSDPDNPLEGAGAAAEPDLDDDDDKDEPLFRIELDFADRATYQRCRRALRRAAGKGNPLAEGLIKVLAAEDEQ